MYISHCMQNKIEYANNYLHHLNIIIKNLKKIYNDCIHTFFLNLELHKKNVLILEKNYLKVLSWK